MTPRRERRSLRASLVELGGRLGDGSELRRFRRLGTGLSATTHAVDLDTPEHERVRLVLRRFTNDRMHGPQNDVAQREGALLRLLVDAGVPVSTPVFVDAEGTIFGVQAIVTDRLPGRPWRPTAVSPNGLRQLAAATAGLHSLSRSPPSWQRPGLPITLVDAGLPSWPASQNLANPSSPVDLHDVVNKLEAACPEDDVRGEVVDTLAAALDDDLVCPGAVIHGDFHLGNVLWNRRQFSGIVDWEVARIGPAGVDLTAARVDAALCADPGAAERLLEEYVAAGGTVLHQWFHDLVAIATAFGGCRWWVGPMRDTGISDASEEILHARLRPFAAHVLGSVPK